MVIPVPQSSAPSPRSSGGLLSLKRMPLVIGIVVVVIILAVVASMAASKTGKPGQSSAKGSTNISKASSTLPVSPGNPDVTGVVAVYSFSGQVESVSSNSLTLKSSADKLPAFKVSDKTPVFKVGADKKSQKASLKDIKSGSKVSISAVYNLSNSSWQVSRVVLQP